MYATELHRSFSDTYCTFIALSAISKMHQFKLYFGFNNIEVDDNFHVMT